MSMVDNETFKNCFCDGSCALNGICGGNRQWYGPGYVTLKGHTTNTTTIPKPTVAEELRRKADLAQRDKRAKARAKHDDLYNNHISPALTQEASKGNYHLEIHEPQFQVLTKDEFDSFIDYLTDLGFYVEQMTDSNRVLWIDWQERVNLGLGIKRTPEILCSAETPTTTWRK